MKYFMFIIMTPTSEANGLTDRERSKQAKGQTERQTHREIEREGG